MPAYSPQTLLECENVGHGFGAKPVLYNINLRVAEGQFVALVGPSGCGKSTLLRAILGTHPPREGSVRMDGKPYRTPHRDRGIVYQRYSLFPFLTAQQNVAFGLMLDQTDFYFRWLRFWKWRNLRRQHLAEADAILEKVGLEASGQQYPEELSGGMRQRVAVAQALIMRPKLLLLDEPFGALDQATREELQLMLLQLYAENLKAREKQLPPPFTMIIVTHELNEALYVSDRVIGLSQYHAEGHLGATIVYDRPAPVFSPDNTKDFGTFVAQREEILQTVFDREAVQQHSQYVSFWNKRPELRAIAESTAGTGGG